MPEANTKADPQDAGAAAAREKFPQPDPAEPNVAPSATDEAPAGETNELVAQLQTINAELEKNRQALEAIVNGSANALAQEGTGTYVCTKAKHDSAGFHAELKLYDASKDGPFDEEITVTVNSRRPNFVEGHKYALVASKLAMALIAALAFSLQPSVVSAKDARFAPAPCASCATAWQPATTCPCRCKPVRRALKRTGNAARNLLRCTVGAPPIPFTPPSCPNQPSAVSR